MTLLDQIREFKAEHKRNAYFTLESGCGETYRNGRPTLYAHGVYPRGSVLRGRPLRRWVQDWETWEEARAELKKLKVKYDDAGPEGGSSHVPVSVMVSHLPDDTDY